MLNLLIKNIVFFIVAGNIVGEDGITDGYGVPTGEFTATDGILFFFAILGFIFFMYLVFKFSFFLVKKFVFNNEEDYEE